MCSCYRPDGAPVPLRNTEYIPTLLLLQRFEPCNAAEAHSIQTILKVKHVWNIITLGQNMFLPQTILLPLPHLLQLHQLTFTCSSKPTPLFSPPTYSFFVKCAPK